MYGTALFDGTTGGVAFELAPNSNGWVYAVLHSFAGGSDGLVPNGPLVSDGKGHLFGTTQVGGGLGTCSSFCGTVFELSLARGVWTETVLYSFTGGSDGSIPGAGLAIDKNENLYGTTSVGGLSGYGTVFELTPVTGGGWTETVLHSFAGGSDGAVPSSGALTFDKLGNLYGTTGLGGSSNNGVVFEVTP